MKKIFVSDVTIKLAAETMGKPLSFRQKIELAKLLDRLGLSVIETAPMLNGKEDSLLVKSLASSLQGSILCVPVDIQNPDSIELTWNALSGAAHPRLQVSVPVSTVQMEYLCHKKPEAILKLVSEMVARCAALCPDVEFVAEDYGRSDRSFVQEVIQAAVKAGATLITIFDTAGTLLDDEYYSSTKWLREFLPDGVRLGVWCSNEMYLADAGAVAAVRAGADEIKTMPYGNITTTLSRFVKILSTKSTECGVCCDVKITEMQRVVAQIKSLCDAGRKTNALTMDGLGSKSDEIQLTMHDSLSSVLQVAGKLGYELSEEDGQAVYDAFLSLASKTEKVEVKELDAIIASVAFQAPPVYRLESYLVNSGNQIRSVCHLRLKKGQDIIESVCLGDGPIDAAFQAIEKIVGTHYELDDFQIQSVTEGREAMGRTIVRLRRNGKVYSGMGISRDIVGAGIMGYLSALNKILNEEDTL